MALRRHDQTENCILEETQSNMQAFGTILSEHEDMVIYAKHSVVVSKGGTDQDTYHAAFKNRSRSMTSSTRRKLQKAIHMIEAAFQTFNLYRGFKYDECRNELFEARGETLQVIQAGSERLKTIKDKETQKEGTNSFQLSYSEE